MKLRLRPGSSTLVTASVAVAAVLLVYGVLSLVPDWPSSGQTAAGGAMRKVSSATFTIHGAARPVPSSQLAATPPMGWNGFNHFYIRVTETTIEAQARALVSSGMAAAGYTYVNLDGGWDMPVRTAKGELQPMPKRFPHGIKPVADYVHSLGLKFGIYTSAGMTNCARTSAGSYGHFSEDAQLFASWNVDYVKLDWCGVPYDRYRKMTRQQVSLMLATQMRAALNATGRSMILDVNVNAEFGPWTWAPGIANLWRTGRDSHDQWSSLVWNFTQNVHQYAWAGPGHWNDPDMLEVGNGGMTEAEYRAQFSLWAEMAAPLIAGNDLTAMSPAIARILTNRAVIGVDQDPLGRQGRPVASAGGHWVLVKPLASGAVAVVLFNSTDHAATVTASLSDLGLSDTAAYTSLDLWSGQTGEVLGTVSALIAPHDVVMLELTPA